MAKSSKALLFNYVFTRKYIELFVKCTLVGFTLYIALLSIESVFVDRLARYNPVSAYQMYPKSPRSIAAFVNYRLKRQDLDFSAVDKARVRLGLLKAPLNRSLVRTMGVIADLENRRSDAAAAMYLSHRISRRDPVTQLWLATYRSRQRNFISALTHYSAALEVEPALKVVLFPQMALALPDDDFKLALRPYLLNQASWLDDFMLDSMPRYFSEIDYLAAICASEKSCGSHQNLFASLAYRWQSNGNLKRSHFYLSQIIGKVEMVDFERFTPSEVNTDTRLGALAWSLQSNTGISSSLIESGGFKISVPPLSHGIAISRDVPVQEGSEFRFFHRTTMGSRESEPSLSWKGECLVDGQYVTTFEAKIIRGSNEFNIPILKECHLLRLSVLVVGNEGQFPAEVLIEGLRTVSS